MLRRGQGLRGTHQPRLVARTHFRTPEHRSLNGLHEARVNCEPTSDSALSAYDHEADLSGHHNDDSAPGQGDPWAEP